MASVYSIGVVSTDWAVAKRNRDNAYVCVNKDNEGRNTENIKKNEGFISLVQY